MKNEQIWPTSVCLSMYRAERAWIRVDILFGSKRIFPLHTHYLMIIVEEIHVRKDLNACLWGNSCWHLDTTVLCQSRVTCHQVLSCPVLRTPSLYFSLLKSVHMDELKKSTGWDAEVLTSFSVHDKICEPHHDIYALYISLFLCVGLVVSYLPQVRRITTWIGRNAYRLSSFAPYSTIELYPTKRVKDLVHGSCYLALFRPHPASSTSYYYSGMPSLAAVCWWV
jgi:hypothetical protein